MGDIRGFMRQPREDQVRRPVTDRILDWNEFYEPIASDLVKNQASRCMDCGVPFCQSHTGCPLGNFIPQWNDLVHRDRWKEAVNLLHSTNNFPEFTGKLCPAPCESACVLGIHSQAVTIKLIENKIIDHAFENGWVKPVMAHRKTHQRVAVVGSGPAGLAAAQELARMGHEVTVFEKNSDFGGLLRYGIPDFKLEKWILDRRLGQLRSEGVQFQSSVQVGVDVSYVELQDHYPSICLTLGAEQARDLEVPGRNLKGIVFAMDYLKKQNQAVGNSRSQELADEWSAKGKRVIVIGGGDTGSDCVGTARRQGCRDVSQFEILPQPPPERAKETPWPLWPLLLRTSHAHEEGCVREWGLATIEFLGNSGKVEKLCAKRVHFDNEREPIPVEFDVDLVILALGFEGSRQSGTALDQPERDHRGRIKTDKNFMTSIPGMFSAGDSRRGASLIVWAIAEGRQMAKAVDRYLSI